MRGGEPALDVGCGTGRLVLDYLQQGIECDGVDNSPEMLALCREKARVLHVSPNLYQQPMQDLGLPRRYRTISSSARRRSSCPGACPLDSRQCRKGWSRPPDVTSTDQRAAYPAAMIPWSTLYRRIRRRQSDPYRDRQTRRRRPRHDGTMVVSRVRRRARRRDSVQIQKPN